MDYPELRNFPKRFAIESPADVMKAFDTTIQLDRLPERRQWN